LAFRKTQFDEDFVSQRLVIIQAALATESLLVIASYITSGLFEVPLPISAPPLGFTTAVTVGFVAVNWGFGILSERFPLKFPALTTLKRKLLEPLGSMVSSSVITFIAVLSGFAEELFFRGALAGLLNQWCGPIASFFLVNAAFAGVHFLGQLSRYAHVLPYYFLAGAYLSAVTIWSGGNLVPAMVVHGMNNWVILQQLRRRSSRLRS
jgi:membrane protease YdiL (CAAX protease family)